MDGIGRGVWVLGVAAAFAAWGGTAVASDCASLRLTYEQRVENCTEALDAAATPDEEADILLDRAHTRTLLDDYTGAEADVAAALALVPDNPRAFVERGRLLMRQSRDADAIKAFEEALEIDPDNKDAQIYRLDARITFGEGDCAAEADALIAAFPDEPYLYATRGRCHLEAEAVDLAIADLEKAAGMDFEQPFVYANLAMAYLEAGRGEDALRAIEHAIVLNPRFDYAQMAHFTILTRQGEIDQAFQAYNMAVRLVDNDMDLTNELGWELYKAGEAAAALPMMEDLFASDAAVTSFEADTFAHILSAVGRKDEAADMFMRAAELGGAEQAEFYRETLQGLGIDVAEGEAGLRAALVQCVEQQDGCRLE